MSAFYVVELVRLGSADRAVTRASAAVDASVGVDNILAVALGNRVYGAALCASAASDALIGNLICHSELPPEFITHLSVL